MAWGVLAGGKLGGTWAGAGKKLGESWVAGVYAWRVTGTAGKGAAAPPPVVAKSAAGRPGPMQPMRPMRRLLVVSLLVAATVVHVVLGLTLALMWLCAHLALPTPSDVGNMSGNITDNMAPSTPDNRAGGMTRSMAGNMAAGGGGSAMRGWARDRQRVWQQVHTAKQRRAGEGGCVWKEAHAAEQGLLHTWAALLALGLAVCAPSGFAAAWPRLSAWAGPVNSLVARVWGQPTPMWEMWAAWAAWARGGLMVLAPSLRASAGAGARQLLHGGRDGWAVRLGSWVAGLCSVVHSGPLDMVLLLPVVLATPALVWGRQVLVNGCSMGQESLQAVQGALINGLSMGCGSSGAEQGAVTGARSVAQVSLRAEGRQTGGTEGDVWAAGRQAVGTEGEVGAEGRQVEVAGKRGEGLGPESGSGDVSWHSGGHNSGASTLIATGQGSSKAHEGARLSRGSTWVSCGLHALACAAVACAVLDLDQGGYWVQACAAGLLMAWSSGFIQSRQ